MSTFIHFLKKNILIILIALILGNIYYLFNTNEKTDRYVATLKIKTSSLVYDRLNDLMNEIIISTKKDKNTATLNYQSYRNEQYYIFEVFIESPDSAKIMQTAPLISEMIKTDTIIKMYYFEKLLALSKIIDAQTNYQKITDSLINKGKYNDEVKNDLRYKRLIMELNTFNINLSKTNLLREFEIYPFSAKNIKYEKSSGLKDWIKINIVLFILAVFGSIIYRQLKN
jgi:hypothetical protein